MPPPTPKTAAKRPATRPITASRISRGRSRTTVLACVAMASAPDVDLALAPIAEAPERAAVLLDVDGTLAPIAAHPDDARLIEGAPEALAALGRRVGLLAFVSGRRIPDVDRILGIPGAIVAGNHGLQMRGAGGEVELAAGVERHTPAVAAFARSLGGSELEARGITLEDKGATLTLHFRRAPSPEAAEHFLREAIVPAAEAAGLRPTWGRMVLEVRPPVAVDKGTAVRALLAARPELRTATYFGDDRTDADAWRALRALVDEGLLDVGICIAAAAGGEVPPELASEADAVLDGPVEVVAALRALAGA
jgi:trehalose 6-phosphate phosphatase